MNSTPDIGLVLCGGGGRGAYQIGVWQALNELGLDRYVNGVSGTSVGALNAALFACGDTTSLKISGLPCDARTSPIPLIQPGACFSA